MRWLVLAAVLAVVALMFALPTEDTPRNDPVRTAVGVPPRRSEPDPKTDRPSVPTETRASRRIEVHVVAPGETPVQGALVRFVVQGQERARTETDTQGRAWLDISSEGRVAVTRCQPFPPALSKPVGDREKIVVRLAGGILAIAGTVVDEHGRPAEATVMAKVGNPDPWMGEWHWVGRSVRRPKGQFRIEGLLPGRYRLSVHAAGAPDGGLVAAGDESVRIRLSPVCLVTLRWIDRATGKAVRSLCRVWEGDVVRASATRGHSEDLPTNLRVAPGTTMRLHASADGYRTTEPVEIEIGADERARTIRFELDPDPDALAHLTLMVRGSDGAIVKKLTIMRMQKDGGFGTTYESEDGRYEFALPPGRNELRFGPLLRYKAHPPYAVVSLSWKLERGERRTETVTLPLGGWLRRPAPKAKVEPVAKHCPRFIWIARDDYRMLLAPGRYTVSAPGESGALLTGEVTIDAGKVHEVTLR